MGRGRFHTRLVQSPCAPHYRAPVQCENLFLSRLCTRRRACSGSQKTQCSGSLPLHGCPFEWFVTHTEQISIIVCVGVSLCFWDSSLSAGLTPLHPILRCFPSPFSVSAHRFSFQFYGTFFFLVGTRVQWSGQARPELIILSLFKKGFLALIYICECFACMYVCLCTTCMLSAHKKAEEGMGSSRTKIISSSEPLPHGAGPL